jgi:hypothetical protein
VNPNPQTDADLETLQSIVATLVALAGLADRASRAPHPVRAFVLWLLRRGEAVVREWLAGPGHPWPVAIRVGSNPRDALDLAASLRALAHAVEDLAADHRRLERWWRRRDAGEAEEHHVLGRRHGNAIARRPSLRVYVMPYRDTS